MTRPPSLLLGAGLAVAEALVLLVFAVLDVVNATEDRLGSAVATAVFFALLGVGLLVCAYGLWHLESWARSPVVVVQLIILLTAWSLADLSRSAAIVFAGVSVATLVCLLHPASIRAMAAKHHRPE